MSASIGFSSDHLTSSRLQLALIPCPVTQQPFHRIGRHRPREQVALNILAPLAFEHFELRDTCTVKAAGVAAIFVAHDTVRLKRTLDEQFCYLLGAGCDYSGRDMRTAHTEMGVTKADMNALVENLQAAMREAGVPFAAQNRLLAKLAPMSGQVVER